MFVLILLGMLMTSLCMFAILKYVFHVYDQEMYVRSSQSLNLSAYGVENELKKMERLSFRIATDPTIQKNLMLVKEKGSNYDEYKIASNIKERMLELGGLEKYVLSMQLFDIRDQEYGSGIQAIETGFLKKEQLKRETSPMLGGNRWIFPDSTDKALISAREIRSFANLEFNRLGMIDIRINLEKLSQDYARGLDAQGALFFIMNDSGPLLTTDIPVPVAQIRQAMRTTRGYEVLQQNGRRYFMTYVPSDYTRWSYVILIPYDTLFQTTLNVQKFVLIIFGLLFAAAVLVSLRFARGITRPIESLNAKMKMVQRGNFQDPAHADDLHFPMDEAGQLHRNFRIMLQRINDLITENYTKQLAIKESEFKALQAQINPHFLYNTLESINWHARIAGQPQISRMVESLGHLLRNALNHQEPIITLKEEILMMSHYITIQKMRFEERLDYRLDILSAIQECLVPKMILQPLVENAIQYGLERIVGICTISIHAETDEGSIHLLVEDNGPGIDSRTAAAVLEGTIKTRGTGIGLRNIHERIRLIYGEPYGMRIGQRAGGGTKIELWMPMKWREDHG